jgi:hypothetical protein
VTSESPLLVGGPLLMLAAVLILGLYVPPPLQRMLIAAAQGLGVAAP